MKKLLIITLTIIGTSTAAFSQDIIGVNPEIRADRLNEKMAKDLKLNNYQQAKLDEINTELMAKIIEAELKYMDDPKKQEEECRELCVVRDQKLQNVLSTDQYSNYFRAREQFFQYDRKHFAPSNIGMKVAPTASQQN